MPTTKGTPKKKPYSVHSVVRAALRRVWLWSPMRSAALSAAREKRGVYRCAKCKELANNKNVAVDHITPAGSIQPNLSDLGVFANRLFFGRLQVLCKPCHKIKTKEENDIRFKGKPKK